MESIKIKCPNKTCEKEIDFTFDSPEECPRCGKVLFPAIDRLAKEVSKEIDKAQKEVEKIFKDKKIKHKILTEVGDFPGCAIIIKDEKGIEKIKELIVEYNNKHEERKKIDYKRDLLFRDNLVVYPKISAQDARNEIRQLELYRFLRFIISKKHTIK